MTELIEQNLSQSKNYQKMKQVNRTKSMPRCHYSRSAYLQIYHYINGRNTCCILCYRHRLRRLMRQPTLGIHHERLREPRNNLTEKDTGVSHLHYQLPHHPHQLIQWLHQSWLSNHVLTLKKLMNKSLVYDRPFS